MMRWLPRSGVSLIAMVRSGLVISGPAAIAGAAALAVMLLSPATARATTHLPIIINVGAQKCLDMTGGSTANNAQPQLWTCNGNPQQDWQLRFLANGYVLIENDHSHKCLSILDNNPHPGAEVIQYNCNFSGNDNFENWELDNCSITSHFCMISNEGNDNYMSPKNCDTARGTKMYEGNACNGNAAGVWDLRYV